MNNYEWMVFRVHEAYREDDWRRADQWRRVHARLDALPLHAEQTVDEAPRGRLAFFRRLIPRHA
jgi:hypothetical protein